MQKFIKKYRHKWRRKAEAPKATVVFSASAMSKMLALVMKCELEVGWHGVGKKLGKGLYKIDDIILYPQTTTSTNISADDEKYAQWVTSLAMTDEKTFSGLCMHGHSHVNMATFASATDKETQEDIVAMLPEDGFYIFLIINKSLSMFKKIIDREDGLIYKGENVDIQVENDVFASLSKEYGKYVTEQQPLYIYDRKECLSYEYE